MKLMLIDLLKLMQHFDTCQPNRMADNDSDGADTYKDADTDNDA